MHTREKLCPAVDHDLQLIPLQVGVLVPQPRIISAINGKIITLNIPLTDSLNATNGIMDPIQLTPYTPPPQPSEMGIENLSMKVSPTCSGRVLDDSTCNNAAVSISEWTVDSWVRDLDLTGFNNHIKVIENSTRITITSVTMNRDNATDNDKGYALDISIDGTQVLVHNCKTLGEKETKSYSVATNSLTPGPNACIGYEAQQPIESIEPHQRWAHGFLNEGSKGAAILYRNRAGAGSGHGWTVNNGSCLLSFDILFETSPSPSVGIMDRVADNDSCGMEYKRLLLRHSKSYPGQRVLHWMCRAQEHKRRQQRDFHIGRVFC